jgi:hypothetical protein
MAFDPDLANRIRELTASERGLDEKRMFGGLAFLVNGNMAVAATREGGLMVRVSRDEGEKTGAPRARRAHGDGWPGDARLAADLQPRREDQTAAPIVGRPGCRLRQEPAAQVVFGTPVRIAINIEAA